MIPYNMVVIAAAIGIVPVAGWLWLMVAYGKRHRRGNSFFMKIFFIGVLTAIPASVIEIILMEYGGGGQIISAMQSVWSFGQNSAVLPVIVSSGIIATIEEVSKGAGIAYSIYSDKFLSRKDGLIFGIVIGLAFAVTENGIYFANLMGDQNISDIYPVVIMRFLLSTSAHVIYSGIMGKYFADAALENGLFKKGFLFAVGIIFASSVHCSFNFLLSTSFSSLIVFIIVFGMYVLWAFYHDKGKIFADSPLRGFLNRS